MKSLDKLRVELQGMSVDCYSSKNPQKYPMVRFSINELIYRLNEIADDVEEAELIEPKTFKDFEYFYNLHKGATLTGYLPKDLLHQFFNSRSDANKYLTAEQQEDLEKEFSEYWDKLSYKL